MFDLTEDWVWDFWIADDGSLFHLFFLKAPRSLGDSDRRHDHASIGHAVSPDLHEWAVVADPVHPVSGDYDDLATWTGSLVRDGDGWRMFHTGRTLADGGRVQRIGSETSSDLRTWMRDDAGAWPLEADPRFYDVTGGTVHWRDPWVVRDDAGGWHMYATARLPGQGSGVVGHAVSDDLRTWRVRPPLSEPTGRFEWLEVISVVRVEGRWVLLFSCLSAEMPGAGPGEGGVWSVPVSGPGAPVDVAAAVRITDERSYVGKVVRDRAGRWQFLAFVNRDERGRFRGGVTDPAPVRWRADARGLELEMAPSGPGG